MSLHGLLLPDTGDALDCLRLLYAHNAELRNADDNADDMEQALLNCTARCCAALQDLAKASNHGLDLDTALGAAGGSSSAAQWAVCLRVAMDASLCLEGTLQVKRELHATAQRC